MKKLLTAILLPLLLASAMGQYNVPDQAKLSQLTGTAPVGLYIDQVYAASINIDPSRGLYQKVSTTAAVGNATLTISDKGRWGEYIDIEIANDAGGARTITFGTGFTAATSTLVGTISKSAVISFRSNSSTWVEAYRSTGGSGGGGTPAGITGDLQTNAAGVFGALTPGAGISTWLATPTSANLATAVTNETGSGALVFGTSPTLITPTLGAATATSLNGNTFTIGTYTLTGSAAKTLTFTNSLTFAGTDGSTLNIGTGGTLGTSAYVTLGTNVGTWLTTPSSANLIAALTDETGTGAAVFANTPTLVTPIIGAATGTSLVLTGNVTTGSGGSVAGGIQMGQGTLPGLGTTAATWSAPTSVTSHNVVVPGAVGTTGYMKWTVGGTTATISTVSAVEKIAVFSVDGGGSAITTGTVAGTSTANSGFTLTGWSISATGATGTNTIKIWNAATGSAIPTIANVINTNGVSLTTGTTVYSTTLTDFTDQTYAAQDLFRCAITAVDGTATDLTVTLFGTKL